MFATPFVLLRSKGSIELGTHWFYEFWYSPEARVFSPRGLIVLSICLVLTFRSMGDNFYKSFFNFTEGSELPVIIINATMGLVIFLLWFSVLAVVVGVAFRVSFRRILVSAKPLNYFFAFFVALMIFVSSNFYAAVFGGIMYLLLIGVLRSSIAYGLGIWLRSVFNRIASVVLTLPQGTRNLPNNWREMVLQVDVMKPPEIVPGFEDSRPANLLSKWREEADPDRQLSEFAVSTNGVMVIAMCFLPSLLWRWAIKSTAWFYIPLLWVGRGWLALDDRKLLVWGKSYSSKWLNRAGVILTGTLLFTSLVALFLPEAYFDLRGKLSESGAPMTPLGWAFVFDWGDLAKQPWQWFYLPSWVLTLTLFFMVDAHAKDIKEGEAPVSDHVLPLRRWMWVSNARTLLTNFGLAVALAYFLSAVDAWSKIRNFFLFSAS